MIYSNKCEAVLVSTVFGYREAMTSESVQPGSIIDGRFEVLGELGEGGMGVVFSARHLKMDRTVAIKLLKESLLPDREQTDRFMREARLASQLQHPNIVHVYSIGLAQSGQPYIAMEYVEGQRLADLIAERKFLKPAEALPIFLQVCDALAHAHEHKVVHRDLKPSNIMICHEESGDQTAKILDFGIAKSVAENQQVPAVTRTGVLMGSAFYLSPGQCMGRQSDVRSDIYSLGCTLFEALSGRPPFVGESFYDTLDKQIHEETPNINDLNPDARISSELQSVINCMMEKEPVNRYQSMEQLKRDLSAVLAGAAPTHIPRKQQDSPAAISTRQRKNNTRSVFIATGAICALAVAAVLFATRSPQPKAEPAPADSIQTHYHRAFSAEEKGDLAVAEAEYLQCIEGARQIGDKLKQVEVMHRLAWMKVKAWRDRKGAYAPLEKAQRAERDMVACAAILAPDVDAGLKRNEQNVLFREELNLLLTIYYDGFMSAVQLGKDDYAVDWAEKHVQLFQRAPKNIINDRRRTQVGRTLLYRVGAAIESNDVKNARKYLKILKENQELIGMTEDRILELGKKIRIASQINSGKTGAKRANSLFAEYGYHLPPDAPSR